MNTAKIISRLSKQLDSNLGAIALQLTQNNCEQRRQSRRPVVFFYLRNVMHNQSEVVEHIALLTMRDDRAVSIRTRTTQNRVRFRRASGDAEQRWHSREETNNGSHRYAWTETERRIVKTENKKSSQTATKFERRYRLCHDRRRTATRATTKHF